MKILEHKIIKIRLKDLKFDKTNPNVMTEEQKEGLRKSMERFGYTQPVIIDQNNKIADGEHRAKIYADSDPKGEIPAIRIKFDNDNERRVLRQAMNKLRGSHDLVKDYAELQVIQKYNQELLLDMLGVGERDIQEMKHLIDVNDRAGLIMDPKTGEEDKYMTEHYADSFLHGNVKQIIIYFQNEEYEDIIPKIQRIMPLLNVDSHTDLFKKLVYDEIERRGLRKEFEGNKVKATVKT